MLNQSANLNVNFKQKSFGFEQYSILNASTNYNSAKTPQAEKSSKDLGTENPVNQFFMVLFLYYQFKILRYSRKLAKLSSETVSNNDPSVQKARLCQKILLLLSA